LDKARLEFRGFTYHFPAWKQEKPGEFQREWRVTDGNLSVRAIPCRLTQTLLQWFADKTH
jgi:hypothetical protein